MNVHNADSLHLSSFEMIEQIANCLLILGEILLPLINKDTDLGQNRTVFVPRRKSIVHFLPCILSEPDIGTGARRILILVFESRLLRTMGFDVGAQGGRLPFMTVETLEQIVGEESMSLALGNARDFLAPTGRKEGHSGGNQVLLRVGRN